MRNLLALVSFKIYPADMGGQKGVALFYQYLSRHFNIIMAAPPQDNQELLLLYPNKKIYFNVFRLSSLKKQAINNNVTLIISEHSYTGWIGWALSRLTQKPFIIHSHNIEASRFRKMGRPWWWLYARYEAWIHRKAAFNFFISEEDKEVAIQSFGLKPELCMVVTYGIQKRSFPDNKRSLKKQLGFNEDDILFYFNGTLDYQPNYDAVRLIVEKINPYLASRLRRYQIILTGNRIPEELISLLEKADHVHYGGFVPDTDHYYQCADLFINPVRNDTGVKTKLVEALSNHCTALSFHSGAAGVRKELSGEKLVTVEDQNWEAFAQKMIDLSQTENKPTPDSFFEYYSWENIIEKAALKINELIA